MKIYMDSYVGEKEEQKTTIEIPDGCDVFEVMTAVRGLLIAAGFHPNSVVDGCEYIIEEFGEEDEIHKQAQITEELS